MDVVHWIVLLAVIGFVNALFLYTKKKKNEKPVCVIGSDCNKVIRSRYSTTFGVENTLMGMIYYFCVVFAVLLLPLLGLSSSLLWLGLRVGVTLAALMSLYLLYIQLLVLKEWCDYCLLAALINLLLDVLVWL